jgi:putative transposon-encoded protein
MMENKEYQDEGIELATIEMKPLPKEMPPYANINPRIESVVKKFGTGAHIVLPIKFVGKKVIVEVLENEN